MTRRGLILFALMSVIWGIPYLFIRIAVAEISPPTLVFVRTGLAALILVPVALLRDDLRSVVARWRWLVAFAVIEIAVPWVMLGAAEQRVSSSLSGLMIAGVPLAGTLIALVTRSGEHLDRTGLTGLLIGLIGVAAIVGLNSGSSNAIAFVELGIVIAGYAAGPYILRRYLNGLPAVAVMGLSLLLCAVVYAPVVAFQPPARLPTVQVMIAIAVLAVVCTAIAFLLFSALIDEIGPVRATVITYINPAVAAVLGVTILHEAFTPGMAIGLALVILGSGLATRGRTPEGR